MQKAFTLAELLIGIAILTVLAALLFPVLVQSKRQSAMAETISNLHQVGVAVALYRSEHGGEGVYGDSWSMGLPDNPAKLKAYGIAETMRFWPSGERQRERRVLYVRYQQPPDEKGRQYPWSKYAQKNLDGSVTFASMSYTDEEQPLRSLFGTFLGLGVRLDTSVMKRRRSGVWDDYSWWE